MHPAAQPALAVVAVALLLAQAPSKPTPQQREADREHARQLLARAAALITEVEEPDQRIMLFTQLGLAYSQSGESQAGSAALQSALDELQKPRPGKARSPFVARANLINAYVRADDLAGAQRVVEAAPESERHSAFESLVRSVAFKQQPKLRASASLASQIRDETRREQILIGILRDRGRNAPVEDVEYVLSLMSTAAGRSVAQSYLGAAKIRAGDPSGDRELGDAARAALTAKDQPSAGSMAYYLGCAEREHRESERDAAVRHVATVRLQAGDIAGALAGVEDIQAVSGREDLLAKIAYAQGFKGDIAGAQQSASRITRTECRDNALEGISVALEKAGDIAGALRIVSSFSAPDSRAESLNAIAVRELAAKRHASALQVAIEGFQHAAQIADIEDRITWGSWLAMVQAEAGNLAVARQSMQQLLRDYEAAPPVRPRGPSPAVRRLAVCHAGIGEAPAMIAFLRSEKAHEGPELFLPMARHQSSVGDLSGALRWVDSLATPAARAFGLIGAASGLISGRSGYRAC